MFRNQTLKALFSKFFSASDRESVVEAVCESGSSRVVFIDCPATAVMVETVQAMLEKGLEVIIRDHHDAPARKNDREAAINDAANSLRSMVGEAAVISTRDEHPACSSLISSGEFAGEDTILVADSDPDGLTAAMKARGITYPELDSDAAVLDGPRTAQGPDTLSATALLMTRAMSALPPFNPKAPERLENAKGELFEQFVAFVQGDSDAESALAKKAEAYEAGVREAKRIAETATEVTSGVWLVDCREADRFDMGTLANDLERRDGCRVTVQVKAFGPIAAKHGGTQYSLAVPRKLQKEINLQELLPAEFESSPESGIISNTSFLLHVSEEVWTNTVLPGLSS